MQCKLVTTRSAALYYLLLYVPMRNAVQTRSINLPCPCTCRIITIISSSNTAAGNLVICMTAVLFVQEQRRLHTTHQNNVMVMVLWFTITQWGVGKKVPNSRGNLRTVKTCTVFLEYRRKLVTLKVNFVHTVINWCALCFICVCISLN